jgi:O-antigen ligase
MNDIKQHHDNDENVWLDAILHSAQPAEVEDAGFSNRVMARIAAEQAAAHARQSYVQQVRRDRRLTLFSVVGALIGVILIALTGSWESFAALGMALSTATSLNSTVIPAVLTYVLALLSVAAVAYSLNGE